MGDIVSSGRAWGASIAITGPTGHRQAYGLADPEDTLNPAARCLWTTTSASAPTRKTFGAGDPHGAGQGGTWPQ